MSKKELSTFARAMQEKEFQDMLGDYVDEISDPKHRPEHDQYLREMFGIIVISANGGGKN